MKSIDKIGLLVTLSIIPINNLSTIFPEINFCMDLQKFILNYTMLVSISPMKKLLSCKSNKLT